MYFEKLLNEKQDGENSGRDEYDDNKAEVEFTLKKMRSGRTLGLDGIPIEVWRSLDKSELCWLTKLFNKIIIIRKLLEEWRRSILVPIYKNKSDI